MKRALVVQPCLNPPGGGNGVAAWILEALKHDFRVTVLTWVPVDREAVNRFYGTSLAEGDFEVLPVPRRLRALLDRLPVPLFLLRNQLLVRLARPLAPGYDLVVTANNEADFGRPAVQYIHFPWTYHPRPDAPARWYRNPFLHLVLRLYYALAAAVGGFSPRRAARNLTLVNSDWTGELYRSALGGRTTTLHPPAAGEFPAVPWEEREEGLVCLGRISPEKELEKVIAIVEELRRRGHGLRLHLVGTGVDPGYHRRILALAEDGRPWVELHENLSREELARFLAGRRYGIHGMREEHFGMAVAEMVRAGCLPFVPRGGGQVEIVGHEDLLYDGVEDAVERIAAVLREPARQAALRASLAGRAARFGPEAFVARLREVLSENGPTWERTTAP